MKEQLVPLPPGGRNSELHIILWRSLQDQAEAGAAREIKR